MEIINKYLTSKGFFMKLAKRSANYKGLFVLGMSLMAVGIATKIIVLSITGFVFLMISLVNRKKWQNN